MSIEEVYLNQTISDGSFKYKLEECMGGGEFGVVFRAESETPEGEKITLALKFPKDSEYIENIEKAADIMTQVGSHPHIVDFRGIGHSEELQTPYLKFEFLRGKDLGNYIADLKKGNRAVDPYKTLYIMDQIIDAIEHLHRNNVIHADLTPSNVRIVSDGTVKVMDFGISQIISADRYKNRVTSKRTKYYVKSKGKSDEGVWINKSEYLPNDFIKYGAITVQYDIYSLGKLLYFLLVGQDHSQEIDTVEILNTEEWSFVNGILKKCVCDIQKRYDSIEDFKQALKTGIEEHAYSDFRDIYRDTMQYLKSPKHDSGLNVISDKGVEELGKQHYDFLRHPSLNKYKEIDIISEGIKEIDELIKNRIEHDVGALCEWYLMNKEFGETERIKIQHILEAWKNYPVQEILDYCKKTRFEVRGGPIVIDDKVFHEISLLK